METPLAEDHTGTLSSRMSDGIQDRRLARILSLLQVHVQYSQYWSVPSCAGLPGIQSAALAIISSLGGQRSTHRLASTGGGPQRRQTKASEVRLQGVSCFQLGFLRFLAVPLLATGVDLRCSIGFSKPFQPHSLPPHCISGSLLCPGLKSSVADCRSLTAA